MKIIILLGLILYGQSLYSQCPDSTEIAKVEKEVKTLNNNGGILLFIAGVSHAIATSMTINGLKGNPDATIPFVIFNSFGLFFDTMALITFNKGRKIKKDLNESIKII